LLIETPESHAWELLQVLKRGERRGRHIGRYEYLAAEMGCRWIILDKEAGQSYDEAEPSR
jgi:hypothetical protein